MLEIPAGTFPNRISIYVDQIYIETLLPETLQYGTVLNLGNIPGTLQILQDSFGYPSGFLDDFS